MKQTKIQFISKGFREILVGAGTKDVVTQVTNNIQSRANGSVGEDSEGYSANVWMGGYGGGRWIGSVTTTDRASQIGIIYTPEHSGLTGGRKRRG